MPGRRSTPSTLCLIACALIVLIGGGWSSAARAQTCCGFSGNCYQPGPFGNCGGDTDIGNVSCSPNPCVGRCCDFTTGACTLGVPGNGFGSPNCNGGAGGFSLGLTSCSMSPCPPSGACCAGNGSCSVLTAAGCAGGVYQGNNSICGPIPCTGSCCDLGTGNCTLVGSAQCTSAQFGGLGSTCTANLCSGACCNQITGACTLTGPNACTGSTLAYSGLHTTCGAGSCAQPGACCAAVSFACSTSTAMYCAATSGTFEGVGTTCSPPPCPQPASPTAFTYQGRLTGGPASGVIGARFSLWDNATSAAIVNRVAGPTTIFAVPLNASLFTAIVDFGSRLPIDRRTWLQIEVDTGSGYITLNPRQLMTFAPLAAHAAAAGVAGTASQTLCLGPGAFVALDSSKRVVNSWADGVWLGVAGADELVAPINLPAGAKIDLVTAYVNDTVTADLEFSVVAKVNGNSSSNGAGIDFVVAGSAGYISRTFTGGPVINASQAYSLRVFPAAGVGTGQWPGNNTLAVQNVVITWHMP